ncbi:phosphatidylglycerophosphatase A [Shimia biformata]|uniref:phosphatidylglycerophosphatase A family protein n=1 Tax=Shimia biformata TaxID=1294299 RepID=UPI00194F1933|nr:phosphatidylglycerophosphatase A [Shimia biformata]
MKTMIATVGGVGFLRPAPGTWGSAVGVGLALGLHWLGGFPLLVIATVAAFFVGWWATAGYTAKTGDHDPGEVVIDEVAGQFIALWVVSFGAWHAGLPALALYPGWIAGFVLFRIFDITKPSIIGKADRRGDALGVMLDDIWAGVFAAICTGVLAWISHGVLGL